MESESKIRKEVSRSAITVSRVYKSDYQKEGTLTAELKQIVTTKSYYPSKNVENSLSNNVFSIKEFGFEEKEYESKETRVTWISVPVNSTIKSVQEKLNSVKEANLYRILSNRPILADTQQHAINNPELNVTTDTFANKQVIRYPEGNEKAGQLALDKNGKIQYRVIAFTSLGIKDKDLRTEEPTDFYASAEIKAEMNNVVQIPKGQSI